MNSLNKTKTAVFIPLFLFAFWRLYHKNVFYMFAEYVQELQFNVQYLGYSTVSLKLCVTTDQTNQLAKFYPFAEDKCD